VPLLKRLRACRLLTASVALVPEVFSSVNASPTLPSRYTLRRKPLTRLAFADPQPLQASQRNTAAAATRRLWKTTAERWSAAAGGEHCDSP